MISAICGADGGVDGGISLKQYGRFPSAKRAAKRFMFEEISEATILSEPHSIRMSSKS